MAKIDPVAEARQIAEAALASMARFEIAPTPNHYLIWYSHHSGCYPELSQRLHRLQQQRAPFTDVCLAELHDHFFGTGRQVRLLDETCRRIEQTMSQLLDEVGGVSRDADRYGDTLADFSHELEDAKVDRSLQQLVATILEETREMQARARALESAITESSQEIQELRSDLIIAQREANTDGLTGIANRKLFDQELRQAAEDAQLTGKPLSLLLADIDHFKRFNDTYGHQIGDQVLRLVAQVLVSTVKGRDLAARYGGEEFAVILPRTVLADAARLAEEIRATTACNQIRLKASGRCLGQITLSIGCAQYCPGEALSELIQRADDALYRAKRTGRNRVVAAPHPAPAAPAAGEPAPA